jgi:hypothetical protein
VTKPDYIEVDRKAHELSATHGRTALSYAKKLADAAHAEGKIEEYEFWNAVYGALRPRDSN